MSRSWIRYLLDRIVLRHSLTNSLVKCFLEFSHCLFLTSLVPGAFIERCFPNLGPTCIRAVVGPCHPTSASLQAYCSFFSPFDYEHELSTKENEGRPSAAIDLTCLSQIKNHRKRRQKSGKLKVWIQWTKFKISSSGICSPNRMFRHSLPTHNGPIGSVMGASHAS